MPTSLWTPAEFQPVSVGEGLVWPFLLLGTHYLNYTHKHAHARKHTNTHFSYFLGLCLILNPVPSWGIILWGTMIPCKENPDCGFLAPVYNCCWIWQVSFCFLPLLPVSFEPGPSKHSCRQYLVMWTENNIETESGTAPMHCFCRGRQWSLCVSREHLSGEGDSLDDPWTDSLNGKTRQNSRPILLRLVRPKHFTLNETEFCIKV